MEHTYKRSAEQTDHRSEASIWETRFSIPISWTLLENLHRTRGNQINFSKYIVTIKIEFVTKNQW